MRLRLVSWMFLVAAAVATASVTAGLAQSPGGSAPATDERAQQPAEAAPEDSAAASDDENDRIAPARANTEQRPAQRARPADDPAAKEKIERALRGKQQQDAPGDDPVLEDVLKIIRGRGSILDGSVLDADAEEAGRAAKAGGGASQPAAAAGRREARVAEMLLRTSRLLESLGPVDRARRELVTEMRGEAARVLSP